MGFREKKTRADGERERPDPLKSVRRCQGDVGFSQALGERCLFRATTYLSMLSSPVER